MGSTAMFTRELTLGGHSKRFTITERVGGGWELREEDDTRVVRRVQLTDWHRVERARMRVDAEVLELEDGGWTPPRDGGRQPTNR